MDFNDSIEEAAFREACREWLTENAPRKERPDEVFGRGMSAAELMQAAREWQGRKAQAGFGAITWPEQFGGRGGSPIQEVIYRQEEGNFKVPVGAFNVSLGMVIPSFFVHADPAVAKQHVSDALHGKELWCQLLSEPGAGSDLGMIRTRAERCTDGRDGWIINGQKVWTTLAQFADCGMVLTRTDPDVPKFAGMTTFFIDMDAPGVEICPIRQANGDAEFNEVFFNDVFIPDNQRVGEVGGGWKVTLTGLMNERLSIGGVMPPELWRTAIKQMQDCDLGYDQSYDQDESRTALQDSAMRQQLSDLYLNAQGLWLLQCRGLTALGQGREPGAELSVAKIVAARTLQDFSYFAMDLKGTQGILTAEDLGDSWQLVEQLWMGAAGMRIAGGTDEIVKNNVGERVLGLPPEPRADKGMTFKQLLG